MSPPQIKLEMRIIQRYLKPLWMLLILLILSGLWLFFGDYAPLHLDGNLSLYGGILILSIYGIYFQDFFWGGNHEPYFRYIFPSDFQTIILHKNLLISGLVIGVLLVLQVLLFIIGEINWLNIVEAWGYILSVLILLVCFGNRATIKIRSKYKTAIGYGSFFKYGIRFFLSSIPYIFFEVIFNNPIFIYGFIILAGIGWYYLSIPGTSKKLLVHKYDILEGL